MKENPKHYINNRKMYEAIKEYKEKCKEAEAQGLPKPKIPEYLGECIWLLAHRISNAPNFYNYSYKDEMIADGIRNSIAYFDNFDPDKYTNPFGYFSKIIFNAFKQRINLEKKYQYERYKIAEVMYLSEQIWEDSNHKIQREANEVADNFIKDYEEKLTAKKKKSKVGLEKFME